MSEDVNNNNHDNSKKDEIQMPDFTELWKELYFKNEKDWSQTFKNFISTDTFVKLLDKTLEQYLAYTKVTNQHMDKYSEYSPIPSKKDLSRVAELVISLEEKVDLMEFQLYDNFKSLAENLGRMANFQEKFSEELSLIKIELESIDSKMEQMSKKSSSSKNSRPSKKQASSKKTSADSEKK